MKFQSLPALLLSLVLSVPSVRAEETKSPDQKKLMQEDFGKQPTYIKSDNLTLKQNERLFTYSGNVEVKQGDMTLTSTTLDGKYNDNNKIEQLVAHTNVVIVKGETIRGTGEKAVYEAATETVTLTENPELQQEGSILSADIIKIFLKEDRSTAEGSVRVKLVKKEGQDQDLKSFMGK